MLTQMFPMLAQLFKNREKEKRIEDIMAGRWLPNTPTAEAVYQVYVERGLPIDREYAEKIYDEWLQKNDEAFIGEALANRGTPQEEPPVAMAKEDAPKVAPDPVRIVRKLFGIPDVEASTDEAPNPSPLRPLGDGEAFAPQTDGQRQTDPFIRMLQTALVMRMLGGTGGAFGALALAPILKDLFDEMMGRKKRDTGQGEKGEEQPKVPQTVPEEGRPSLPSKGVDEVVIQLYNRGLSPQQIGLALPSVMEEVDLSPQQIEQILNNSGVQGVHIPTTAPKKKEGTKGQKKQNPQGQKQKQNPQGKQKPQGRR